MADYLDFRPPMRIQATLALSPDGSMVAYADDQSGQFNLSIAPVRCGDAKSLTAFTENTVRHVVWSPDGKRLMCVVDRRGDEYSQLYLVTAENGDVRQLTDALSVRHVQARGNSFSPDGRRLAYGANDREPSAQDVLVRDLETDETTRVFARGGYSWAGYWSPDGTRLTIVEWVDQNIDHIVYVADLSTGTTTQITFDLEPTIYRLGPWLPDGSGFHVITNRDREFDGLALLDVDTGSLTWVDSPDWDVDEIAASADLSVLAWLVDNDGATELKIRDTASGNVRQMNGLPLGVGTNLCVSDDGQVVAMLMSTASMPTNILCVEPAYGVIKWTTNFTTQAHRTHQFVEPTLVHYPARSGVDIPAYVYRPHDRDDPVGVVVSIHGGPTAQERPSYIYNGMYQYMLSKGVALFCPNIHGSGGYGSSYMKSIYRDWGGIDLQDLDDAIGHLLAQPWVDPTRIGLFGGSYGGFAVLSCISRLPHRAFAAASVWFGPSNLVTLATECPPTWRSSVDRILGNPERDYEFLMSRSPVTYCDQIDTPLQILQGANDPRVPQNESEQIVDRLRLRGVTVDYTVFPDEGHGFMKTANEIAARSTTADYLVRHLADKN